MKKTPLMIQYDQIKSEHRDKLLFFQMGDFFEMFHEDAKKASSILNIALTVRNKNAKIKTLMCGVPKHSISSPISKLLKAGHHVAICEQLEAPRPGKPLVKRAVTRILSPGMVYDLDSLDSLKANYISSFDESSISFLDLSTGEAFYYEIKNLEEIKKLLDNYQPAEVILSLSQKEKLSYEFNQLSLTVFEEDLLEKEESLKNFFSKYKDYPFSVRRLISYVFHRKNMESLKLLRDFERLSLKKEVFCSKHLYTHLEVFKNYEGKNSDTLFSAIKRTKSAPGSRLLKKRLLSPITDKKELEKRWDEIEFWIKNPKKMEKIRDVLSSLGDGERGLGKLTHPSCDGRSLNALSLWLEKVLELNKVHPFLKKESLLTIQSLQKRLSSTLKENPPVGIKQGGMIKEGVSPGLDEWILFVKNSQKLLLEIEERERKKLQIPSLKVRYNSIFGYYIEVTKTHKHKVPSHYLRKQTLTQAERYTTEELDQLEKKILSARGKRFEMEERIFLELKAHILENISFLLNLCSKSSEMDLSSSQAFLSLEMNYVRPQFSNTLSLKSSRHPVLEQKSFHEFVPNDIEFERHHTVILTGPNMAGKSTLMRQVALTSLLAQSGLYVPASKAQLPLFTKIFTRIGASDLLSQGLSTFLLEMKESSEILEKADSESLVILDELGRGTATFDGMSLAQAIIEYLTVEKKPLVFSATHYHELTKLSQEHPCLSNASMLVEEKKEDLKFLYLLSPRPASKSYGLQAAKMAGLPLSTLKRAKELLIEHERGQKTRIERKKTKNLEFSFPPSLELKNKNKSETKENLMSEVKNFPLLYKTPMEAFEQIKKWQEMTSDSFDPKLSHSSPKNKDPKTIS